MPAEHPPWALSSSGLPSVHVARAALNAAAIIDRTGSAIGDADESHWHQASGGVFPPHDLARGRRLLVDVGLLLERDGTLRLTPMLEELLEGTVDDAMAALAIAALGRGLGLSEPVRDGLASAATSGSRIDDDLAQFVPDAEQREAFLVELGRRFNDAQRRLVGEIGEETVVAAARAELRALGHGQLAREVRRVSLLSDQLGYDVRAPRVEGAPRMLEVKSSGVAAGDTFSFVLSRGEFRTGQRYSGWALVACTVEDVAARRGKVLGWCSPDLLHRTVPDDREMASWESVRVTMPVQQLLPGLPSPIA